MVRSPRAMLLATAVLVAPGSSCAEVLINGALPLTRRVEVQPIRVRKTTGAIANAFGNASQENYIKFQISRIWSQAGVRVDWRPLLEYTNDFVYDGSPANYTTVARPSADLGLIHSQTPSPPKSASALVINLFFIQIVPGSPQTAANRSNGVSFVDSNGIAVYAGNTIFTSPSGLDAAARLIARQIGHNLGLEQAPTATENLMSPALTGGTTGKITPEQIQTISLDAAGRIDGFDFMRTIPVSNYSQWAALTGALGGPTADDDDDGMDNLTEFMLQRNPRAGDLPPAPVPASNGLTWTLAKHPPAIADGLVYRVTTSDNLLTWLPAGADGSRSTIVRDDSSAIAVRLAPGGGRRFMRLDVSLPAVISPASTAAAARNLPAAPSTGTAEGGGD